MKRADWVRPLLELLEGQARRAGPNGLSTGQKALAAHLFDIILTEVVLICETLQGRIGSHTALLSKVVSMVKWLHGCYANSALHIVCELYTPRHQLGCNSTAISTPPCA